MLLVFLVIIASVVGMKKYYLTDGRTAVSKEALPINDALKTAQDIAEKNDIESAFKFYDEQIDTRNNANEIKILLLDKAEVAKIHGRIKEAEDAIKKADEVAPDYATAEAMARIFEKNGDSQSALMYYKKAIELAPADGMASRYVPVWEERIAELEK